MMDMNSFLVGLAVGCALGIIGIRAVASSYRGKMVELGEALLKEAKRLNETIEGDKTTASTR